MTIRQLRLISVSYLLLPNLLFFFFWTNSILAAFCLGICGWLYYSEFRDQQFSRSAALRLPEIFKILLTGAMLSLLAGVCGFFYQTDDYWAHNTKFYELFTHDWPLRIPTDGPVVGYYYGYYVVPAFISKIVGRLSEAAIFGWTMLGMSLGVAWLYISLGHKIRYMLLVLTIGDFGHFCSSAISKLFGFRYPFEHFGIEMWSNFENLFWVPNQIIPSMLMGGMLVYCVRKGIAAERMVFPVVLSLWWAVFPAFTSLVLVAAMVAGKWFKRLLTGFTLEEICTVLLPLILAIPVLLLFISHERPAVIGWIWNFNSRFGYRLLEYALNVGLNVAAMIFLYRYFSRNDRTRKLDAAFYLVAMLLLLLPLVRIGKVNDLLIRGFMPLLIVAGLSIFQFASVLDFHKKLFSSRITGTMLFVAFCILGASLPGIGRVARAMKVNAISTQLLPASVPFEPVPYNAYSNVYEVLRARWSQAEADQYLGKSDSVYERFIAPE